MESLENINIILKENNLGIILKFNKEHWLCVEPWRTTYIASDLKITNNLEVNDLKEKEIIGISVYERRKEDDKELFFKKFNKPINYEKILKMIKQKLADYKLKAI